jgi:hypothetical protein
VKISTTRAAGQATLLIGHAGSVHKRLQVVNQGMVAVVLGE